MTVTAEPHAYAAIALDAVARDALGALGDAIRRAGPDGWCEEMLQGSPIARDTLVAHLPPAALDVLVDAGIADVEGSDINFVTTIAVLGGVLTAVPKQRYGPDVVYIGPDTSHLVEAVVRLAPRGARAAELGVGTGLLTAILAARYRVVAGTDLGHSVAVAAAMTMAMNRHPPEHAAVMCVADVADGLRPHAFDLVAGNAPWVPTPASSDVPRELFSHGGETGVEVPRRFLLEGAALLRPRGIAITLALDVELHDGSRPLRESVEELERDGFLTAVVSTPWNRERANFVEVMRERQPSIVHAEHVAVVAAKPSEPGDSRPSLFIAVEALRQRWATREVVRSTTR